MAVSRVWAAVEWAVVPLCVACGGQAGDRGGEEPSSGLGAPSGEQDVAEAAHFRVDEVRTSNSGSENRGCFGAVSFDENLDEQSCLLTRELELRDLHYRDEDADGKVEPGETLTLFVTLAAPVEHNNYPGVYVRAQSPSVWPEVAGDARYAIPAVDPAEDLTSTFDVSAAARPGEILPFAVCATGSYVSCRQVDELDFELTVE